MSAIYVCIGVAGWALMSWSAFRVIRTFGNTEPTRKDVASCVFIGIGFWWLMLPLFAIVIGIDCAKRREELRTIQIRELQSGAENGLYEWRD